jgi:methyl-accepting chemotaxis protein
VAQVGEAITSLDQTTQQNAALVEEMSAAANSLRGQAGELVHAVSIFKLGGREGGFAHLRHTQGARAHKARVAKPRLANVVKGIPLQKTKSASVMAPVSATGGDDWETF